MASQNSQDLTGLLAQGSLIDRYNALSSDERRSLLLVLCEHALHVWKDYVREQGEITYIDSVVGMLHKVDADLPMNAFKAIDKFDLIDDSICEEISKKYREPIVAMEDD